MTADAALAAIQGEVNTLRELGAVASEKALARWSRLAHAALEVETRRWLTEARAVRRGPALAWLRARYPTWERMGYARRTDEGLREYHEAVIPIRRLHAEAAADPVEQARRDAGEAAA